MIILKDSTKCSMKTSNIRLLSANRMELQNPTFKTKNGIFDLFRVGISRIRRTSTNTHFINIGLKRPFLSSNGDLASIVRCNTNIFAIIQFEAPVVSEIDRWDLQNPLIRSRPSNRWSLEVVVYTAIDSFTSVGKIFSNKQLQRLSRKCR